MQPAIDLKKKINSRVPTLGVLATDHVWTGMIEICSKAGLDYIVIDQEHGAHPDQLVADCCTIGRLIGFPVLVRGISTDYSVVRRLLDLGPCGVMFPCVEEVEQLDRVREAAFMPPRGKRRPGGLGNHWMKDYQYETWKRDYEDHLIVLPQIETRRGVANAAKIAAHEMTTALALGPYDLSAELGCCWNPDHPDHRAAIQTCREAADKAGKNLWTLGDGPTMLKRGFSFICIGEPTWMLRAKFASVVEEVRGASGAKAPSGEHG